MTNGTELPPELANKIGIFSERFGEVERLARFRPGRPCVVMATEHVGYIAYDEVTTRAVKREGERLEWARNSSIPCPATEEVTDSWLIVHRVSNDDVSRGEYIELALGAADQIAAAPPPPRAKTGSRSSSRNTVLRRGTRMLRGGVWPPEFVTLRRSYEQLPKESVGHGDFHPNNVLFDASRQAVGVIDWSHLGMYPRLADHALFWAQTRDKPMRDLALEGIRRRGMTHDTSVVLGWMALRSLVELVSSAPKAAIDKAKLAHARTVLDEARVLGKEAAIPKR